MAWKRYNSNPTYQSRGDCVIRAISKVLNFSWDQTYIELCIQGFLIKDWGNSNNVWDAYLRGKGFTRKVIPNTCPDCYTIGDFTIDNPKGLFVLGTGEHVVAIKDGDIYDTWDSSDLVPLSVFYKDVKPKEE